jgi:hypothetical protein
MCTIGGVIHRRIARKRTPTDFDKTRLVIHRQPRTRTIEVMYGHKAYRPAVHIKLAKNGSLAASSRIGDVRRGDTVERPGRFLGRNFPSVLLLAEVCTGAIGTGNVGTIGTMVCPGDTKTFPIKQMISTLKHSTHAWAPNQPWSSIVRLKPIRSQIVVPTVVPIGAERLRGGGGANSAAAKIFDEK